MVNISFKNLQKEQRELVWTQFQIYFSLIYRQSTYHQFCLSAIHVILKLVRILAGGQKAGRFAAAPPSEQNGNVCLHQGPYPSSLLDAPPVSQASPPTKKIKIIKKEASPEF